MSLVLGILSIIFVIVFGLIAFGSSFALVTSKASGAYYNKEFAPLSILFPFLIALIYAVLAKNFLSF